MRNENFEQKTERFFALNFFAGFWNFSRFFRSAHDSRASCLDVERPAKRL